MTTIEISIPTKSVEDTQASTRFGELDSLRGVAAFVVMIHHYLLALPSFYPYGEGSVYTRIFTYTPLHLLWAGYESVLLFFTLSGFVLSLPYWQRGVFDYGSFVVKRWCRVWVPYILVVSMSALLAVVLARGDVPGTSSWFAYAWAGRGIAAYLQHFFLILDLVPVSAAYIPVVWSLKYEMLASLSFPLLLFISRVVPAGGRMQSITTEPISRRLFETRRDGVPIRVLCS